MRVLVTGATGKIGSRVVPRLVARGHAVCVLVRQPEQRETFRRQEVDAVIGDLLQPETLGAAVGDVDAVLHLAAFFRGATPERALATNLTGTLSLARAALAAGVPRFIFASTNLVYGSGLGHPAWEDDPLHPADGYPTSKAEAERALGELHESHGLGLRIVRLAFVYGEGDPHLAEFAPRLGTWPQARRLHLVHHTDVAQATMLVLDASGIDERIYNVADDEPMPVGEILRFTGRPATVEGTEAPFDPWEGIVDTTRISDELAFRPIFPSLSDAHDAEAL